uniref:Protein Z, vitamin K-dependent plasma glycoprotein a n=1 Tax=Lepisosteus oculatus TaxID=7918 RepID=W5M4Z9_LEPOC
FPPVLVLTLVGRIFLSLVECEITVFLDRATASRIIGRHRRANHRNEESLPPNLERECVEEVCNYEEAREIFKDSYRTDIFWTVYIDGDQCANKPCKNGAMCADSIGGYDCICKSGFSGVHCETDQTLCTGNEDKGCSQFCQPGFQSYQCSCASGYELREKGKCVSLGEFSCGKVSTSRLKDPRVLEQSIKTHSSSVSLPCATGECPWQALLKSEQSDGFCTGVILKDNLVLTTAQCATKFSSFQVVVGKMQIPYEEGEQVLYVKSIHKHPKHVAGRPENDLALVELRERIRFKRQAAAPCLPERDFAENVLMGETSKALVMGWNYTGDALHGSLKLSSFSYLPLPQCQKKHDGLLTNKMFCTTSPERANCFFGPGAPVVSIHKQVAFLVGLLSRPQGQACEKGFVYQKISRFLPWLRPFMEARRLMSFSSFQKI